MDVTHLRRYFHVVTMVSNPVRFKSRYKLYRQFAKRMAKEGIHFHTIEIQHGQRGFSITEHNNRYHTQLRTEDELWHKENAINLCVNRFHCHWPEWRWVAWIDADVMFHRKDWVNETIQELQNHHVVQMFQQAIDLGPNGEALHLHQGFLWSWWNQCAYKPGYCNWHPGFAWACTREAFTGVGGLIDRAILGSGDRHMALALIGQGSQSYNQGVHPNYKHMVKAWEDRARTYIKRDIGYVKGSLFHFWHGKKVNRQYQDRWQVLVRNQYDPYKDVYPDWQGLLRLEDDRIELRDDIKHYFRCRFEDSIDLE